MHIPSMLDVDASALPMFAGPGRPARVHKGNSGLSASITSQPVKMSSELEERRQKLNEIAAFNVKVSCGGWRTKATLGHA